MEINTKIKPFNIYDKLYRPKFNLGDKVRFITDIEDTDEYMIYAYSIDIKDDIKYRITNKGNYMTVDDYEIELKNND